MLKPFICGSGNFHEREEEDDSQWSSSSSSSPRKHNFKKTKKNKNPYSNRGREKFETVLAELDERRQKIYEQYNGSNDQIEMVRFVYSNSKGWVPIIVKLKDNQKQKKTVDDLHHHHLVGNKEISAHSDESDHSDAVMDDLSSSSLSVSQESNQKPKQDVSNEIMKWKTKRLDLIVRLLRRYVYKYWLVMVIILIMVCLVIHGRSFAIICTSVLWYLMPLVKGNEEDLIYTRRLSFKKHKNKKKDFMRSKSHEGRK